MRSFHSENFTRAAGDRTRSSLMCSIALVLFAGTSTAAAQSDGTEPAEGKTLGKIRVEGAAEDGTGYVPKKARTATKTDTPLLETPQSVSVIPADQIRDQSSPNLQEALRYAAGVRHELYGIDNRGDWLSMRGATDATFLLDGMRLPLTGSWGVVRIEPYAYDRIEVLRGPASIIAGANDPGGVVNLVSKRPLDQAVSEVGVQYGSFDHKQANADFGGSLNRDGTLRYRLVALGKDSDTQIDHADEKRTLIAPSLTWQATEDALITVYTEYQRDRSKNTNAFLGLEGTLEPAPNGPIPRDLFIGEPDWDRYGGRRWRVGYATELTLSDNWQLRHQLRHDDVDGLLKTMYAAWWLGFLDAAGTADPDGEYLGRVWYANEESSSITNGEWLLQGNLQTAGVQHTVLVGVDGLRQSESERTSSGEATPLNVYDPVYGTFDEPPSPTGPASKNQITRIGVLAQDQMRIAEQWSVRLGVRRDVVRNEVRDGDDEKDWATSTNVGVVYQVLPGLAPYVSYSESFNPVSGFDAAGAAFKPKRGRQYEAGLKWEAQSAPVQATASVYSIKEKNRLADDPDNVNFSIQIGEARIKGGEIEARAELASWSVLGSYAYTRARADAGEFGGNLDPDQQIEGIPKHNASLWAVHDFGHVGFDGFKLGGGIRYVGRIGDGTGAVFVPSVTLYDAMASYETGPWRLALNANNVANKSYIAVCLARGDCWFGQERRVVGSVTYRW